MKAIFNVKPPAGTNDIQLSIFIVHKSKKNFFSPLKYILN